MNTPVSRDQIQSALKAFASGNLRDNARRLLNVLGYRSEKRIDLSPNTAEAFLETFDPGKKLNAKAALLDHWRSVDLLFQLTSEDINVAAPERLPFSGGRVDNTIIESYLFFTLELVGSHYTRTQLAGITREVNKLFPMPVMLLFRHGDRLTLSIINRRLGKRDETKDVLEKVTLIKDISWGDPIRAHLDILYDLSLPALYDEFKFHNFVGLHRAWEKRLDTSQLNERFYRDIANWYFWVLQHPGVMLPRGVNADDEQAVSIFIIRLITRLIFCWFLQEKGLLPRDLFRQQAVKPMLKDFAEDSGTYYKVVLQNLFFATLNQEIQKRKFRVYNQSGGRDGNRGVTTLYRYRDALCDPESFVELLKRVPFINGGLFDCLDQVFRSTENKSDVRLDDFSDNAKNPLCLPNTLFFGDEQEVDLSEVYEDKRKRKEKVRGIIEILSRYKFTVEENTPLEQEIALDPELLGKVFENLLASYNPDTRITARKATGSFYTPREIVHYIVDETLIAYLVEQLKINPAEIPPDPPLSKGGTENAPFHKGGRAQRGGISMPETVEHVNGSSDDAEINLRKVFAASVAEFANPFSAKETDTLIAAIDRVKILDPACGSGAFPMGALQRLVDLLNKFDPNNRRWKKQRLERARQDRELAERMQDEVNRESALRDVEMRIADIERSFDTQFHELDFARKLYLVEDCIYGVDIQPIACQIAKLRFFISLIVDQKVDPNAENFGVRPLPNLETKIVAADALVGLPVEGVLRSPEILEKEKELRLVRERHFSARTLQTKEKQRGEDRRLRSELAELFRRNGFSKEVAHKLAAWDPYDQNARSDFFDPEWMFGVTDGFEVVIGNPPYVRIQTLKQQDPQYAEFLKKRYEAASKGNFDLYVVFVERGMQLLKDDGNLAYILPHKFFNAQYGEPLRGLLARGKHLAHIVHFGDEQVFPGSTNYVCLLFLRKAGVGSFRFVKADDLSEWLKTMRGPEIEIPAKKVTATEWNFIVGKGGALLDRLLASRVTLESVTARIFQGIKTSADDIYIIEELEREKSLVRVYSRHNGVEYWLEPDLLHPLIKGGDSKRFKMRKTSLLILFPYAAENSEGVSLIPRDTLRKKLPLTWKYLTDHKKDLESREHGKLAGPQWYQYGRTQALDVMRVPKIFTPDIAPSASFSFDATGETFFTGGVAGGYGILVKPEYSPICILGLLNSRVLDWVIFQTATQFRGGYYSYEARFIRNLPIPQMSRDEQAVVAMLASYLVWLNELNVPENATRERTLMLGYFEQLLNGLTYELFFPNELHAQKLFLFRYVEEAKLPVLAEIPEAKRLNALRETFERIYDLNHPIRGCLFSLGSLETVRIIEGEA